MLLSAPCVRPRTTGAHAARARQAGAPFAFCQYLLAGCLLFVSPAAGVAAQPETCPNPRVGDVAVAIETPEAGATVSGVVTVEGSMTAPEPLFRVELFVGDARRDAMFLDPPATEARFSLRWDASSRAPGPATIRVVACGGSPDEGLLVRGEAAVDVMVESTAAPRTGGTLGQEPVRSKDLEWAPAWVGLTFGIAGLAGFVYALRQAWHDPQNR